MLVECRNPLDTSLTLVDLVFLRPRHRPLPSTISRYKSRAASPTMAAPTRAASFDFFPTPTTRREAERIYLGSPTSFPFQRSSPSSTRSQESSECSEDASSAPHYDDSQEFYSRSTAHLDPRVGPLPPPHQLVLPPIDVINMSTAISPHAMPDAATPRTSMTSREWVIPPRPKPGRKPATDTPPTKRKAQNRAAQRAFRERRAARVGELEELLQQQKDDHDKVDVELKEKVRGLEMEVQSFRSRCLLLESMLDKERKERIRAETEAEALRHQQQQQQDRRSRYPETSAATPQRRGAPARQDNRQDSLPHILPSLETDHVDISNPPLTCGNCGPSSCSCADEAMAAVNSEFSRQNEAVKRPASPSNTFRSDKRQRPSIVTSTSSPAAQDHQTPSGEDSAVTIKDGCGFCKDGTFCVCADAAMNTPAMTPTAEVLPPIIHQIQTPPPSEADTTSAAGPLAVEVTADGAVKLPRRIPAAKRPVLNPRSSRGCGANGPGSCAQCQADPKSGLFCRLMASKLGGGCCGGKGASGGCCKSKKPEMKPITLPSLPSLGLSCAEAYQTLSSHRNFDKASDDIGSWLPKLRATPAPESAKPNRMMPMEVEAASIMSVLKDFDVRFGSAN